MFAISQDVGFQIWTETFCNKVCAKEPKLIITMYNTNTWSIADDMVPATH